MKPTVLFLFNSSDHAPRPWLDDGRFNVVSVDYDNTDHSEANRDEIISQKGLTEQLEAPIIQTQIEMEV